MFKIFKKRKEFPIKLFVVASLLNLFFLVTFLVILDFKYGEKEIKARYFLNENFSEKDPYVTNVPTLKDILRGPIISDYDPMIGNVNSPVVITIFSDFQCEYCVEQEDIMKKILSEYDGKVSLIWKDYPEISDESSSWQASVAARCAQEQGKFWEYHDLLYASEIKKGKDFFIDLAKKLDLREKTFSECLEDPEVNKLIYSNIQEAQALDIYGIPFIYVNDQEIIGGISYDELKKIVDIELEKGGQK